MEIRRRKTAIMISSSLMAGALGAMVSFAQTSPTPKPAGNPAAQSTTPAQASSPQKVVLKVGDSKVTQADVDFLIGNLNPQVRQAVATQGRKPVGDEYAMMVLLSQKAQNEHLDTAPEIQRKIAFEKLQILAQEEYQRIAQGIQVNPDEVNTYYAAHKSDFPEEAEIHEFVVTKRAADAKAGEPGLSAEEAKTRLAEIQKAVEAGTSMDDVAKKYNVANTVMVDPKSVAVRKGQMIPALDKAAFDLQPNQFSAPLETPRAVVMLQMLSRHQPDLKTVAPQIEDNLRQEKVRTTMEDMKAKANIWMDPDYFKEPASSTGASDTPKTPAQP
ncbi:MAG: peptidylprolyl isomerase [Acidobacteria bacterium]|nr:MAG: peptidylprolyl isomerase [Acidobacteriota bacterium]